MASNAIAQVHASGAGPLGSPLLSTFSGSAPYGVRWLASHVNQRLAACRSPLDAAARANSAVGGVQLTLPFHQLAPGANPPAGRTIRRAAFRQASTIWGSARSANGGSRKAIEASGSPPSTYREYP